MGIVDLFAIAIAVFGVPLTAIFGVPPIAKAIARRIEARGGVSDDTLAELDALRAEVDSLRGMAPRLAELEERVDFAERLLARGTEQPRLEPAHGDDA